ncbi:MAG: hypothetical protein JSV66_01210 [Trueperaceae bacterium]|nr:MAG: hypothetical protein JSV66_01210 [Trueperaceae bacterium]
MPRSSLRVVVLLFTLLLASVLAIRTIRSYSSHLLAQQAETDIGWGRLEQARSHLERAVSLTSLDPARRVELARVEGALARWRDSEAARERQLVELAAATRLNPLDGELWAGYGAALTRAERYEAADDALGEALERDPRNAYYWGLIGRLREAEGRFEEALSAYRTAEEIRPGSVQPLIQRMEERLREGRGE